MIRYKEMQTYSPAAAQSSGQTPKRIKKSKKPMAIGKPRSIGTSGVVVSQCQRWCQNSGRRKKGGPPPRTAFLRCHRQSLPGCDGARSPINPDTCSTTVSIDPEASSSNVSNSSGLPNPCQAKPKED